MPHTPGPGQEIAILRHKLRYIGPNILRMHIVCTQSMGNYLSITNVLL